MSGLDRNYSAIVDLGAGTGANLRWLLPALGCGQRWILIDHDAGLLQQSRERTLAWAEQAGFRAHAEANGLAIAGPDFDGTVSMRVHDLSIGLDEIDLPPGCLVTTSALLDLVSRDWLTALVARAATRAASVLWVLTYSGSFTLDPPDADDQLVIDLVNRHQRSDKGFGPALGPDAPAVARSLLERAGFEVAEADSSWHCGPADAALIEALVDGWAEAAAAIAPDDAARIERWRRQRLDQAGARRLDVSVSHVDLVARSRAASAGVIGPA